MFNSEQFAAKGKKCQDSNSSAVVIWSVMPSYAR